MARVVGLVMGLGAVAGAAQPTPAFLCTPIVPVVGQTVTFKDTSTGAPTAWAWTFGDGATSTLQDPTHTFLHAGAFLVTFKPANTDGASTLSRLVTVKPMPLVPRAAYTNSPIAPVAGAAVSFTDTSQGTPTSWTWTFGDGGTSTLQNPTHAFARPGAFMVTLQAANGNGQTSVGRMITVKPETFAVCFSAGAYGTLTGAAQQTVRSGANGTPVTAVPCANQGFVNWTGTGGFAPSTSNPLTVTDVTANMNITANFSHLPTIGAYYPTATTIGKGQTGVLNWSPIAFATSATIDNGVGAIGPGGSGMVLVYPTATTTYTLTATGPGGTSTCAVTINVVPGPAILSFTATPATVTEGQACTLSWTTTGATTFSINNGVGSVTGGSVQVIPPTGTTSYRLTASGPYGVTTHAILVNANEVSLGYTVNPAVYTVNSAVTTNPPVLLGGTLSSYIVSPPLPLGLNLDPSTGVISGTPSAVAAIRAYTVQGTAPDGAPVQTSLVLTVNDIPPAFSYSGGPFNAPVGTSVCLTPASTGGGVAAWSIAPSLPAGLNFNTGTGVISGIPTTMTAAQTYSVGASNTGGTVTHALTLAVTLLPPSIQYSGSTFNFPSNLAMAPLNPTNSGGTASSWSLTPSLPSGLAFDTTCGQLSGTPTAMVQPVPYTITATNAAGSSSVVLTISTTVPGPVFSLQPAGQILTPGAIPTFRAAATGTGTLAYQWFRNGSPISGATGCTYSSPAFQAADDGTGYTVVASDLYGGATTSARAVTSLLHDLGAWLLANPTVAGAIKWQFQAASTDCYQAPDDTDKIAWANWSPSQQADLNQAYLDAASWYSQGAPPVTMTSGGAGPNDEPVNVSPAVGLMTQSTMEAVSSDYMWKLYCANVGFELMLETSRQLPWSVTAYPASALRWLFDSATMGWLMPYGYFSIGTYDSAGLPSLRADNRPRTSFADPRWTYQWLRQAAVPGATRAATLGATLDWMRQNMTHFYGSDDMGTELAVWGYQGYSPISAIVDGTVDSRYPGMGAQHWTAGCHGSTGFLNAALRVLNIPVEPVWVCGHEMAYFPSEDLYMDHGDDPYNQVVKASSSPSLNLLIPSATWRARFSSDETVNILDPADPAGAWVGYSATSFQ